MDNGLLKIVRFSNTSKWSVNDSIFENLKSTYPLACLSELLIRIKEPILVKEDQYYKRITVRLHGLGVLQRDEVIGKSIRTKKQFVAHAGQLIISRIDARNGAFGIVPDELEGAIVTNDFWLFDVTNALPQYLILILSSEIFKKYWQMQSSGTTNRQRVNENDFLSSPIVLPPLEVQKSLIKTYDKLILQAKRFADKSNLYENGIEQYLFETLGIQVQKDNKRSGILNTVNFKNVHQWGYDKVTSSFPYKFTNYAPYSFGSKPSWLEEIKRGKGPKYSKNGSAIILNQKCNRLDQIDLSYAKTVDDSWANSIDNSFCTKIGDILINSTGEGTIGRASLITEDKHVGLLYDSHILLLRVNKDEVNPQIIVDLINSTFGQKQVKMYKSAQATKQTELGIENMKKILFPLPCISVQNEIVEKIKKEKEQKRFYQNKAKELYRFAKKQFIDSVF